MDIQKWLNETLLPRQPPGPTHFSRIPPDGSGQAAQSDRDERKLGASDSSVIEALPRPSMVSPARLQAVQEHSRIAQDNPSSSSHNGSGSDGSSQPYARKPRRKTRAERYKPASKGGHERGSHGRRRRKGESTRTKPKAKRGKVNRQSSIAQSFHAKNVLKDRLTVRSN